MTVPISLEQVGMCWTLATSGLAEEAFYRAVADLCRIAMGTVCGLGGIAWGAWPLPGRRLVPVILGALSLLSIVAYAWSFRELNGEGALIHAARYPFYHALVVAGPLLAGLASIGLAARRGQKSKGKGSCAWP